METNDKLNEIFETCEEWAKEYEGQLLERNCYPKDSDEYRAHEIKMEECKNLIIGALYAVSYFDKELAMNIQCLLIDYRIVKE
ncbi:hypothetical protein QG083_09375 [Kingella kingae]|uniref:hypothetical protein n=1 Tax=Kingella kingae TaxID=504 RepID=UPI00050A0475|nr:hypothetical protein [Kingella kingae]MDK4525282.1 hypothetical protein [Kingella kingae]MDK4533039.1 hypothetical protein [Kingella kingae]MDK4569599.1 hypothetical protein [Kingella kingae]MDK4571544.1 hypothetical protein [Kingella kingae]MDK4573500.1 hypothetical protein [Kingella kingae]